VALARLAGAVQFLTVLPVPGQGAPPGAAAPFFPVVGAAIGAAGALLLEALSPAISRELAAAAVLAFWAVLTGALHEDGLADCFDAIRKGRSPQRSLEILKDSRIGAFGALALILVSLIRWQGLIQMAAPPLPVMVAAGALGRAAVVALAWIARPAGSATGAQFAAQLTTPAALWAVAFGLLAAAFSGLRLAWTFISLTVLIVFGARRFFHARLGGVTGDGLGATCLIVESAILVVASCRTCSW
jgi:adenosylcobinamide-GDP ribazoletransferase